MTRSSSPRTPRSLWYTLGIVLITQVVMTGGRPMVSYRAIALDASLEQLGYIAASFALLSVIAAIPLGTLMDRAGAKWLICGAMAMVTLSLAALVFTDSLLVVIVTQAFMGLGLVTAAIGFQTIVANAGPGESSDSRFGLFTATVSLGQLVGPLAAGALAEGAQALDGFNAGDRFGTVPVFVVLAVLCGAGFVLAAGITERRPVMDPQRTAVLRGAGTVLLVPGMRLAIFASLVVLCTIDVLTIYLPAYGAAHGLSVGVVAAMLATRAATSIAVRLFLAPLLARFGRRVMLTIGCLIGAASLALAPLVPPLGLFGVLAVLGLVLGAAQPLTMSWVSRAAPIRLRSTALGVRLAGNRLGQFLIPAGVGLLAGFAGTGAMFWALAGLLGVTSLLVGRSSMEGGAPPDGGRAESPEA
jgi:MFS family permease